MARDLLIDVPSGDLTLAGGDLMLTTPGLEDTRQRLQVRLEIERGTWLLDTTRGVPWVGEILGPARSTGRLAAQLRAIVGQTPGIVRVERCAATLDRATSRLTYEIIALVEGATSALERVGGQIDTDDDGALTLILSPMGGY